MARLFMLMLSSIFSGSKRKLPDLEFVDSASSLPMVFICDLMVISVMVKRQKTARMSRGNNERYIFLNF